MTLHHKDRIEPSIAQILEVIPQFRTKSAAMAAGKEYGWNGKAILIEKRFEKCWVVGQKDFQDSYVGDIRFECYRFPMLRWDIVNGTKTNQVLICRKYIPEQ